MASIHAEAQDAYTLALRQGQKEFRACAARGEVPYAALLEDEAPDAVSLSQENLGVIDIPAERIAGVRNASRQQAFSPSFLPLLADGSEFANKWIALYAAHLTEGIREPVAAVEYMNRYYISEGNKRVSVLKFVGAGRISGTVVRLIPPKSEAREVLAYYEYLDFYRASAVADLYSGEPGFFPRLMKALGCTGDRRWDEDMRRSFLAAYQNFSAVFRRTSKAALFRDETFLAYLEIFGYQTMRDQSDGEIADGLSRLKSEVAALGQPDGVQLSLDPTPFSEAPLLNRLWPARTDELRVAFLFERTAASSPWTNVHDIGRRKMEKHFAGRVHTMAYSDVVMDENDLDTMERAVADGAKVIFTTTPKLIGASVRSAVRHPEVKILNCSMNMMHPSVRTYYGRVYEAKFLIGAIAGAMSQGDMIGYLADYPMYGVPASINAFAKGALMANPRARVQLEWSCVRGRDPQKAFADAGVTLISGRDLRSLSGTEQNFGLYRLGRDGAEWLAMPYFRWARLYIDIIEGILSGTWKTEAVRAEAHAINYWWGLSSGVIDVLSSGSLPSGTKRLMELMRAAILAGELDPLHPFPEPYLPQELEGASQPAGMLRMDALAPNVVGRLPAWEELIQEAKPIVKLQGLHVPEAERL